MLLEILTSIFLGILAGIFTGLIPGIHVNLVAAIAITLPFASLPLSVFIISLAITHTFINSIPGIYLGAPDEAMALAALPGHRLLLKGRGHQAVFMTVAGSILSLLLALALIPFFIFALPKIYETISAYIGWILLVIMSLLIMRGKFIENLAFFILSGILGLMALNIPNTNMLLPLLSGLFGLSILILSSENAIPAQSYESGHARGLRTLLSATGIASIAAFLPGFGSSHSAIIAQKLSGDIGDEGFLVLTGGINTVNMAISLVTLYTIQKARNGAVVAISQITELSDTHIFLFVTIMLIAGGFAGLLALRLSKVFSRLVQMVNYRILVSGIILFIVLLVLIMTGPIGLLILICATSIGVLAGLRGIPKSHLMGCLVLPVLSYFLL